MEARSLEAMRTPRISTLVGLATLAATTPVAGQGAVNPSVAPRAAALERQGERHLATEMLGKYLATAPDDGSAWFQLGRFYFLDSDDWHRRGHIGEPPGTLYLDFAAAALDQAVRLGVDSGLIYRGRVELDRVLVYLEEHGWPALRAATPAYNAPPLPNFLLELGANLLNSCPVGGVIVTGTDLEALSVMYATFAARRRLDLLPVQPALYATDSVYRNRIAAVLETDPSVPVRQALAGAAERRPVCATPLADSAAIPAGQAIAVRLVRVLGPAGEPVSEAVSVTELLQAGRTDPSPWTRDVAEVYQAAARFNRVLCQSLVSHLGDRPRDGCGS